MTMLRPALSVPKLRPLPKNSFSLEKKPPSTRRLPDTKIRREGMISRAMTSFCEALPWTSKRISKCTRSPGLAFVESRRLPSARVTFVTRLLMDRSRSWLEVPVLPTRARKVRKPEKSKHPLIVPMFTPDPTSELELERNSDDVERFGNHSTEPETNCKVCASPLI